MPAIYKEEPGVDLPVTTAMIMEYPMANAPVPRLIMPYNKFQKLMCYVLQCDHEINGFGNVEMVGNDMFVTDVFMLKQLSNKKRYRVRTDKQALGSHVFHLIKNGGDPSKIKLQWHSHEYLPVFFSKEDLDTIARYSGKCDYLISMVINLSGDLLCRVDIFKPLAVSFLVPVMVALPIPEDRMVEECRREIKDKVWVKYGLVTESAKPNYVHGKNCLLVYPGQASIGGLWNELPKAT